MWFCFLTVLVVGLPNIFICGKGRSGVSADLNTTSHATTKETVVEPDGLRSLSTGAGVRTSQSVPSDATLGTDLARNSASENNSQLTTLTPVGLSQPYPTVNSVLEGDVNYLSRDKTVLTTDHQNSVVPPLRSSDIEVSARAENSTDQTDFDFFIPPAELAAWWGFMTSISEKSKKEKEISACNFTLADLGDLCMGSSWSCQNRCGEHFATDGASQPGTCHCDYKCLMYSACCEDFQQQCPTEMRKAREELTKFDGNAALCYPLTSYKTIIFCPVDYPDNLQKKKCEQAKYISSVHRLFELSFPVTDSLNGHHFLNKACWDCWNGREMEFGEPLSWEVSTVLSIYLEEFYRHDPHIFLSHLWEKPDKCMWQPPAGYVSYYCHPPSLESCSGCAGGNALEEKCISSSETFLQVNNKIYANKYCFFCSDPFVSLWNEFGHNYLSQIECQPPNRTVMIEPTYNMFEFTVIFSLRNTNMYLTVLDREEFGVSYSWKSLKCDEVQFRCDATSCMNNLQPENGRCNENLLLSMMWVQVCFGANSAAMAAKQSSCLKILPYKASSYVTRTIWPWTQHCLQAGPVSREFQVTSVNVVETSQILEFLIHFANAYSGQGKVRLRNCVLLAVSRWVHATSDIVFETKHAKDDPRRVQVDHRETASKDSREENLRKDLEGRSTEEGSQTTPDETYICIYTADDAKTQSDFMLMTENHCYIVFDMPYLDELSQAETQGRNGNVGNQVQVLHIALVVGSWSVVVLLRLVRLIA